MLCSPLRSPARSIAVVTDSVACIPPELWVVEFSPLMGYVCGAGTLGVAFYADQGASLGPLNDACSERGIW